MNKAALTAVVAEKTGLTRKQAGDALDAFVAAVTEEVSKGEKVTIVGFGTFELKERAAHIGRNPATGESIEIAASKAPVFKAGKGFKDAVK
ncbi:MAG: HU family DNA-binding protein [Clostridia bacterium]|nr:HU family DNA-binding protein [Clostridia bacterium]MBQ4086298.1 HU family DNA-binding protein [Clostridia bacterium]